ncbi:AbrB/MazE/SpoVT family DNA-binding domain-containing protein [Marinomonas agarivorans]|nr:AbrB/MazE/SpoVT family DNA-binding domain-containing protein [Marinomonas agarivorans]
MPTAKIFMNNRSQAVRMPAEARFDDTVKLVNVRVLGNERVLSPLENTWDSFFCASTPVSDDFMNERAHQKQTERESFDD